MNIYENTLAKPVGPKDHIKGLADAPVTLVEYCDYECQYCEASYPVLKKAQKQIGNPLRFVFRNFSLKEMHPHAFATATSAEAAGAQGKFCEMHDMLFVHQENLVPQALVNYAERLGLDIVSFVKDINAGTFASKITYDFKTG